MASGSQKIVGFLGLDEVGLELAASLLRSGYDVRALETFSPLMDEFSKLGGKRCGNTTEMSKGLSALVILTYHSDHINDKILEHKGILKGLGKDAVIIVNATLLDVHINKLQKILKAFPETGISLFLWTSTTGGHHTDSIVDMFVSRAVSDDLNGKVMIISSGSSETTHRAQPILSAMCGKLYIFELAFSDIS